MQALGTYAAFGLVIRSQVVLGELAPAADTRAADVEISYGSVAASADAPPGYSVGDAGTLLFIPDVGRYLIRDGREIIVDPEPQGSERNLRLFLLGSAFGALLHQRGLLPLHANAIEIGGRAIAFSGHSGAGKSTIAAWFHDRGHRILSDDVCVVRFDGDGAPRAYPGLPRLRLWREALEAGGRTAEDYARSFDAMDKYDVPTHAAARGNSVPLDRVYLLRKSEDGNARITRLQGVDAVDALVSNTYRGAYLQAIKRTAEHLAACVRLARTVPIFRAERAWGFDRFEEQARLLAEHASAPP